MRPLFIALASIAALLAGTPALANPTKVTLCHYPPTNLENPQTITVGAAAAEAHLASHGDTLGSCADSPGPNPICGNEEWEEGEECDGDPTVCGEDFNICTAECLCDFVPEPDAECSNGEWEECDGDGTPCGGPAWFCTAECLCEEVVTEPYCGDGFVDPGEECDDDPTVCGGTGYFCTADCYCEEVPPESFCGDGTVDPGEECDIDATPCMLAGTGNLCSAGCTCDFGGSCYPADCAASSSRVPSRARSGPT